MSERQPANPPSPPVRGWSRDNVLVLVLAAATLLLFYLCWLIARPFLAPIAWALTLALVAHPMHEWISRRVRNENAAAGLAVLLIAVVIVAPAVFVLYAIVREIETGLRGILPALQSGAWLEAFRATPWANTFSTVAQQANLGAQVEAMIGNVAGRISQVLTGSVWAVLQLILTLFMLFFFFRDRKEAMTALRSLLPLSKKEADQVLERAGQTIHVTVYGTLIVAVIQGTLGGIIFWLLGLPAPVLWGAVMGVLAIVPILGAFIVWIPAAIFLALQGAWMKALILATWGTVVIGLIDNLIYPIVVGKQLRLHTLPVFIAVVGGLAIFGAVGLVLGPLVLAVTDAILETWRRRFAANSG